MQFHRDSEQKMDFFSEILTEWCCEKISAQFACLHNSCPGPGLVLCWSEFLQTHNVAYRTHFRYIIIEFYSSLDLRFDFN